MNKEKNRAALFDQDGVVLDTEGQYDRFWEEQGRRYHPGMPDFHRKIKGQTTTKIIEDYFGGNIERQHKILQELDEFESQMNFPYIPGVEQFIHTLLEHGVKIALVTSSNDTKMRYVLKAHPEFAELFEIIITANKITRSKPAPECYLLAARELHVDPNACCVFEDSFSGIAAGKNAGMKIVGLTTTNPAETIQDKVNQTIPDFTAYTIDQFKHLLD